MKFLQQTVDGCGLQELLNLAKRRLEPGQNVFADDVYDLTLSHLNGESVAGDEEVEILDHLPSFVVTGES